MPTLYDALPIMNPEELEYNYKEIGDKSYAESLDNIKTFYNLGKTIFKNNDRGCRAFNNDVILDELANEESKIFRSIWDKYEYIPYTPSFGWYNYGFPIRSANDFPISYLHKVLELADKLSMVILPVELVNMKDIVKDNLYNYSSLDRSIDRAEEFCKKSGSYMYILCPLSFYNVWNEVMGTTSSTDKYYPEKFESVFLSIDLLIPAQRNLYHMVQANSDNISSLKQNMEDNINMINVKLKSIENRLTFVEETMRMIIGKTRQQESETKDLKIKIAKLERLVYCLLDPLVFFTKDRIDFTNVDHNAKVHVVACFGPEFPVEFFTMNGVNIIMNDREYKSHDMVFIP